MSYWISILSKLKLRIESLRWWAKHLPHAVFSLLWRSLWVALLHDGWYLLEEREPGPLNVQTPTSLSGDKNVQNVYDVFLYVYEIDRSYGWTERMFLIWICRDFTLWEKKEGPGINLGMYWPGLESKKRSGNHLNYKYGSGTHLN